jgi:hypothetical protein
VKGFLAVVDMVAHLGQGRVKEVVGGTELDFKGRLTTSASAVLNMLLLV